MNAREEAVAAAPGQAPVEEREERFPCGQCGASLRYAPGQVWMSCSYCGLEQEIPGADTARQHDTLAPLALSTALDHDPPEALLEETRVLSCRNCGAEVEFEPAVHADECPFCGTPVITGTGRNRHLKPQGLVPFQLGEAEARKRFEAWLAGLWFAPGGLKDYARGDNRFSGIYVPYWAFDADSRSSYSGERGTSYRVGSGKDARTEIRWTRVSGRVARAFRNLTVMASESLPRRYVRGLEPWDLSRVEPYRSEFLSGFRAEAYTVGVAAGHAIARARMEEVIAGDVRRAIGGERQRVHRIDTEFSDETVKHVLLPIWVAAYRYRDRSFRFVINAQSGRVRGERPWSPTKIALAVAAALLAAALLAYSGVFDAIETGL